MADDLIAVEPSADIIREWNDTLGAHPVGEDARAVGQVPICWDPDEGEARKRAHAQFRWFADAGFTDLALIQVGDEGQQRFLDEAAEPLLRRLREAV